MPGRPASGAGRPRPQRARLAGPVPSVGDAIWPLLGACDASTSVVLAPDPRGRPLALWRVIFTTTSPTDRPASGLVAAVSRSARMTGWPGSAWMWPMFPATLTARPISAVAHGQILCGAGQPSR
jgi:hypothetical protein